MPGSWRRFVIDTALRMGRTPRELLASVDAVELEELWIAYQLSPWSDDRADLRQAIGTAVVANSNRGKNVPPFAPKQFMPYHREKPPSERSLLAKLRAIFPSR